MMLALPSALLFFVMLNFQFLKGYCDEMINILNDDYFEGYDTNSKETLDYIIENGKSNVKELPPIKSFPLKDGERFLKPGEIPPYVFDHSPYVFLYTEEVYLPYDIEDYVSHFHVQDRDGNIINYNNDNNDKYSNLTLQKLGNLAKKYKNSTNLFLTSNEEFANNPNWLTGESNKPDLITGKIKNAPSVLIVVDKGNGWVDAYWFYFYSFNLGPFVMGAGPYGNHIGDWEHSLTRFYKGLPIFVWMSAHGGGGAYHYNALERSDINPKRPIIFSARGTHANYPSTGQHAHDIPYGILSDFTDRGALWDPIENYLGYTWDGDKLSIINRESKLDNKKELEIGSDWLLFEGHWGDDKLKPSDPRQKWSLWEWKYIEGPTGPLTKHLSRKSLCQRGKWWNFMNACPPKKFVSAGEGYEKEGGIVCANIFGWVKPKILRTLVDNITWGGGLCYVMNWVYGY